MAEEDRRARRTRRNLQDALMLLIVEKGFERITVQEILNRADVGRSTFYSHFRHKEALLAAGFHDLRDQLRREIDNLASPPAIFDPIRLAEVLFEHAYHNCRVFRALGGRQSGPVVYHELHRVVGDVLREHLRPPVTAGEPGVPYPIAAEFYTGAILALLTWWIDHGFPGGPGALIETFRRLAAP